MRLWIEKILLFSKTICLLPVRKASALQLMALTAIIFMSIIMPQYAVAAPELNSDTRLSTAGYFQLSWSAPSSTLTSSEQYVLQQAENPDFNDAKTLYQGPDQASVISGLGDRTYYYRVRLVIDPDWSETLAVEVKHHSLSRAIGFFTLGALMFLATAIVLLRGARVRSEYLVKH
jgi:hypothetical protein